MKPRCALVLLLFAGGCVAGHADVKQAGTGDARSASPDTGTVRAGGDVRADVDLRLDALQASIERVNAALDQTQTDVRATVQATRDAVNKVTTVNGVTGWQLVIGAACYFLLSKSTDLLAVWRRIPKGSGGHGGPSERTG